MWTNYNPNPKANRTGDCVIRAITKAMGESWERIYIDLFLFAFLMADLPTSNNVWGAYLRKHGFKRHLIPDSCPDCYTVRQFAKDHPNGKYILALTGHVVAVEDGNYFDSWDSGSEIPIYYWQKEED